MADTQPKLGPGRLATEGGVGAAISYYLHEAATTWLGWLPPLPGDASELRWWALVGSGGAILAGIGRAVAWCWRAWRASRDSKDGKETTA